MGQRIEFCQRAALENNHAALCREYEISRRTGYKWLARYRISTALSGYRISVRDVEDFQVELCFGRQLLGMIDLKVDSFLPHVPETKPLGNPHQNCNLT